MGFALIYYAVSGRKWFKGPRINVEHIIHGVATDGESPSNGSSERVAEKALDSSL
jgi:hypothetical protein